MKLRFLFLVFVFLFSCTKSNEEKNDSKDMTNSKIMQDNDVQNIQVANNLPDLNGQEIQVATEDSFRPLNYIDANTGKSTGFEHELVNKICKLLNAKPKWNSIDWENLISSVEEGQMDISVSGITITEDRKKEVDFSVPYLSGKQFMLVRADEDRFDDAKSFSENKDLIAGSQIGTTQFYVAIKKLLDGDTTSPRMKVFDLYPFAIRALLDKDIDMIVSNEIIAYNFIKNTGNKLKLLGEPLGSEDYGMIFSKGSPLVDPFNKAIEALKKEGYIKELKGKWIGSNAKES